MGRLDAWERTLLALMVGGLALRVFHIGQDALEPDSGWYMTMGESLTRYGEFRVPWAPVIEYTHHFPPLYPAFLALFFLPAGPSYAAVQAANLVAAGGFVAAAFFCTRDLYGRRAAFVVGALAATMPAFAEFDTRGLGETFVAALFTVTIWGILKSLDEPRYIVVAGVFAGLGYLAKASMGPFFLLAGGAGFLWRFLYVRWRVFQDKWYLLAGSIFALLVIPWALRNIIRHGSWETQAHAMEALGVLFATPGWPLIVLTAFGWAAFLLLLHALPFVVPITRRLREWRSERTSGILLAVVMPVVIAAFFIAAFSIIESFTIVLSPHPARYALTPLVPLLWLGVRDIDWSDGAPSSEPTGGKQLMRTSAMLAAGGAAIIGLSIGIREASVHAWTTRDVSIMVGGSLVGIILIAFSRRSAWEPIVRKAADGAIAWRASPRKVKGGLAIVLGSALFILTWLNIFDWVPLGLAAAAALVSPSWRHRGIIIPIILLGAALGGGGRAEPYDLLGEALAEMAQPGDTLASPEGIEPMIWPFLPDDMVMIRGAINTTWFVEEIGGPGPAPPGYDVVATFAKKPAVMPGSWLHFQARLLAAGAEGAPGAHLVLHHRNASADGP